MSRTAKERAATVLPSTAVARIDRLLFRLRRARIALIRRVFGAFGYNVVKKADYYSTLPVLDELARTRARWDRPSELAGLDVDVPGMRKLLGELADRWEDDFVGTTGSYLANQRRGFGPGYNMTTVDGRIMPASTIGVIGGGQGSDSNQGNTRAFDFSNIASDGVQAVQVYKTGRADIPAGGIGASVNIATLQPLIHPGSEGSITIKGLTSDHPGLGTVLDKKSVTPEISGAYQWTNDSGKFGIAAFGSYQEKTGSTRSDTVNSWNVQKYGTRAVLDTNGNVITPATGWMARSRAWEP